MPAINIVEGRGAEGCGRQEEAERQLEGPERGSKSGWKEEDGRVIGTRKKVGAKLGADARYTSHRMSTNMRERNAV